MEHAIESAGAAGLGLDAIALAAACRRGRDDGGLAVFFEFWAHVVRRPRSAPASPRYTHASRSRSWARWKAMPGEHGYEFADDPRKLTVAIYAMQLGLSLERLTLPELVDEELGLRMGRLFLDDVARTHGAPEGDTDESHLPTQTAR